LSEHPIRRPEVQADIEAYTQKALENGTGKITVELDFKEGHAISYRLSSDAARRTLNGYHGGLTGKDRKP